MIVIINVSFTKMGIYLKCESINLFCKLIFTYSKPVQIDTVIKSIPKNVGRRKTFRSDDFFRNEINFYKHVLCTLLEHQSQVKVENAPRNDTFSEIAKYITSFTDGANDFIVLEDLSQEGYETVCRQTGMDFNHCKLGLETLGKFHGLSLAMHHYKPKEFEKLLDYVEETYYSTKYRDWYKKFQESQIKVALDAVQKEYPATEVEKKTSSFLLDGLFDKMCAIAQDRNEYSVISHGDCW